MQSWGQALFEFTTNEAALISKLLLRHVNLLIATRKHAKQQLMVQQQREMARKIKEVRARARDRPRKTDLLRPLLSMPPPPLAL